ncbi:MAG: hypothetical protein IJQ73_11485, partial [Kiritimatiellae bacterium]|nr:hypothetical protein [Kiritimatiellia bacterium]
PGFAPAAEKPAPAAAQKPAPAAAPSAAAPGGPGFVPAAAAAIPSRDVSSREGEVDLRQEKEANPWRLSVGYEWRPAVKAKFQFVPGRYTAGKATAAGTSLPSQSAAESAASKGDYDDGYVHPDSGSSTDGNTSSWSADSMSQYSASAETLTFSSSYGVSQASLKAPTAASGEEKEDLTGVTFDLSRDIWSNGAFTLRAAVGFSYLFEKEMVDFTHAFPLGSSYTSVRTITAVYDVSYWMGMVPPSLQNQGHGETGAVIPSKASQVTDNAGSGGGSSITYNGGADFSLDYQMMELRLALEPEYAFADWLALYGQLGVALGRGKASWETSSWFSSNGSRRNYTASGEEEDTFVQGFAGIGLRIMPLENLGVSVFGDYRFGKGELDVEANPYVGTLETGVLRYGAALTLAF